MKDKQMKGNESSSEWMECLSEVYLYLWPTACNLSSMMVRGSKRLGTVQEVKCDAQRRKKNEQFQNPKARLCLVSERERERESHLHRPSTIYYQLLTNSNLRKKKKKEKNSWRRKWLRISSALNSLCLSLLQLQYIYCDEPTSVGAFEPVA